ncbi:MAG: GAF domain-containing protein, partial [Anaerolineales bacterium]
MNQSNFQPDPQTQYTEDLTTNALFERIRQILAAPVFEDSREKNRKSRITNTTLLAALAASFLLMIGILLTNPNPGLLLAFLVFVQISMVVGLVFLRRGRVNEVTIGVIFFIWVAFAVQSILFGTVFNPMLPSLIMIIYMAGLMIGNQAAILYAVLSAIMVGLTVLVEVNEMITPVIQSDTTKFSIQLGVIYFLMAGLVILSNRFSRENVQQLEKTSQALAESETEKEELKTYLEQTVEENTRQLERRNKYLEAAALVGQRAISTFNLQEMLDTIANEISQQLGFYHTGIFLVDERREWAVMQAASSEGGKQMIARNHRLAVGKQGMVGFVTSIGQPRLTQDIELDRIHSVAPELPDTRAELTLPLKTRDRIIGAIDIQDTNPNAFTNEDVSVLQTMADQIALAVENTRLFEQAQQNLEEIQRVYGEYSQQAWVETYQKNLLSSYRYAGGTISKLEKENVPELTGNKISSPVNVRGITIGEIEMAKEDQSTGWSNDEIKLLQTLSDQLGAALDSARLFNETQLRASSEQVISEVSS